MAAMDSFRRDLRLGDFRLYSEIVPLLGARREETYPRTGLLGSIPPRIIVSRVIFFLPVA